MCGNYEDRRVFELDKEIDYPPCLQIVEKVAEIEGRDVVEMPPIEGWISTDSLERIISKGRGIDVQFTYYRYIVTIVNGVSVSITPKQ